MKYDEQELRKEVQESTSYIRASGKLDEAVKSVYQRYGTDLSAFFRDAYKAAAREGEQETSDNELEACA